MLYDQGKLMMALGGLSVGLRPLPELSVASRGDTYQTNVFGKEQGGSLGAAIISHGP